MDLVRKPKPSLDFNSKHMIGPNAHKGFAINVQPIQKVEVKETEEIYTSIQTSFYNNGNGDGDEDDSEDYNY